MYIVYTCNGFFPPKAGLVDKKINVRMGEREGLGRRLHVGRGIYYQEYNSCVS